MAEGSGSQKVNPNLVAEIVSSYVAKNSVPVDQVGGLIAAIHQTLSGLGNAGTRGAVVGVGSAAFETHDVVGLHRSADWHRCRGRLLLRWAERRCSARNLAARSD